MGRISIFSPSYELEWEKTWDSCSNHSRSYRLSPTDTNEHDFLHSLGRFWLAWRTEWATRPRRSKNDSNPSSDNASHQCLLHGIQRESFSGSNRCHEREEYTEDNRRFRVNRASFVPGPTHVNGGDRNPRMPHGPELRFNCDGQLRNRIELQAPSLNSASVCSLP